MPLQPEFQATMPDTERPCGLRPVITPSPPGRSPVPRTFEVFDEESCRYFLREVGEEVVTQYTFNFGIEEAFSRILEEYGDEGAPDATSVLQELLEDPASANDLGDDGDIWRC